MNSNPAFTAFAAWSTLVAGLKDLVIVFDAVSSAERTLRFQFQTNFVLSA